MLARAVIRVHVTHTVTHHGILNFALWRLCIKIKQPSWVRWKAVAPARKSQKEWLLSDNDPTSCGSLNVGPVQAFREIGNLPPFTLAVNFVVLQNGQKWGPWTRISTKFYTRMTPCKQPTWKILKNHPTHQKSYSLPPDHSPSHVLTKLKGVNCEQNVF